MSSNDKFVIDFIAKIIPDEKSLNNYQKKIKEILNMQSGTARRNSLKNMGFSDENEIKKIASYTSKSMNKLIDENRNYIKESIKNTRELTREAKIQEDKRSSLVKSNMQKLSKVSKEASEKAIAIKKAELEEIERLEKQSIEKQNAINKANNMKSRVISPEELSKMKTGGQTVHGIQFGEVSKGNTVYAGEGGEKSYELSSQSIAQNGDILKLKRKILETENETLHVEDKIEVDSSQRLKNQKELSAEQKKELNLKNHIAALEAKGKSYGGAIPNGRVIKSTELSSNNLPEGISRLSKEIDVGHNKFVQYEEIIDKTGKTLAKHQTGLREATRDHKTFAGQMKIATQRIAEWGIATSLVYGTFRQLKEGIAFIVELDNKMNEVRMVTGATADEAKRLSQEYNNLASQMGATTMDVANMANEFYRQGLGAEETNNRMKETIKYSKIAGMTTQETAEIITASANSYGFAGEEISTMVDQLSYLGDASAAGKHKCPFM